MLYVQTKRDMYFTFSIHVFSSQSLLVRIPTLICAVEIAGASGPGAKTPLPVSYKNSKLHLNFEVPKSSSFFIHRLHVVNKTRCRLLASITAEQTYLNLGVCRSSVGKVDVDKKIPTVMICVANRRPRKGNIREGLYNTPCPVRQKRGTQLSHASQ